MYIKNKKGQSTVEYVLLVTAVLAVIIAFVTGNGSMFKSQLNSTLNQTTNMMNTESSSLVGSHESPPGAVTNPETLDPTVNQTQ